MTSFEIEREEIPQIRIKVIGIGGAGSNAVDSMIKADVKNIELAVINTDARILGRSACPTRVQIGEDLTGGLGTGGNPDLGRQCAESSKEALSALLDDTDMLFISAGLGGGTGTGATPVLARLAREKGILTTAILTKPFRFEGMQRARKAEMGLKQIREFVDTLIVISNDRLLEVVGRKTTLVEAFGVANNVLTQSVRSIGNLISTPGLVNVDFADVRSIMTARGGAILGVGAGKGENRATEAVEKACASPLLDKFSIEGAKGVLVCICGGANMTLYEIDEAMTLVHKSVDENADVIFGAVVDESLEDELQITLIATGFNGDAEMAPEEATPNRAGRKEVVSSEFDTAAVAAEAAAKAPARETEAGAAPASAFSSFSLKERLASMLKRDEPAPEEGAAGERASTARPAQESDDDLDEAPPSASSSPAQAPRTPPAKETPEYEEDDDTPAFLRRRRSQKNSI